MVNDDDPWSTNQALQSAFRALGAATNCSKDSMVAHAQEKEGWALIQKQPWQTVLYWARNQLTNSHTPALQVTENTQDTTQQT